MSRQRNAVGIARAVWLHNERLKAKPVVEKTAPPKLTLHTPSIEAHIVSVLGERYRDFMIVRTACISGNAEWVVHHAPTQKHKRVVLDYVTACTLPYSDFGKWFTTRVKQAADSILDSLPQRTM